MGGGQGPRTTGGGGQGRVLQWEGVKARVLHGEGVKARVLQGEGVKAAYYRGSSTVRHLENSHNFVETIINVTQWSCHKNTKLQCNYRR